MNENNITSTNNSPSVTSNNRCTTSTPINEKYIHLHIDKFSSDDKAILNKSLNNNNENKTNQVASSSSTVSTNNIINSNTIGKNCKNFNAVNNYLSGKHRKTSSFAMAFKYVKD